VPLLTDPSIPAFFRNAFFSLLSISLFAGLPVLASSIISINVFYPSSFFTNGNYSSFFTTAFTSYGLLNSSFFFSFTYLFEGDFFFLVLSAEYSSSSSY
jgi:hypothetical protein